MTMIEAIESVEIFELREKYKFSYAEISKRFDNLWVRLTRPMTAIELLVFLESAEKQFVMGKLAQKSFPVGGILGLKEIYDDPYC